MTYEPWSAGRRAAAGLLVAVEVVMGVAGLLAGAAGVLFVVADQQATDGSDWKGFGTAIGIGLVLLAVPLVVAGFGLAGVTGAARRTENGAALRRRAQVMLYLAGGWAVLVVAAGRPALGSVVTTAGLLPAFIIGCAALASFAVAGPVKD